MSSKHRSGENPTDDAQTPRDDVQDDETTATARHPLGEEIAEYAPYARNDARNDGGSR